MPLFPNERLPIVEIYREGFHAWKKVFSRVQLLSFLAFLWAAVPYLLLPQFHHYQFNYMLVKMVDQILVTIVYMLGLLVLYAAVYHRIDKILMEEKSSFGESLLAGLKKLIVLVAAVLLSAAALAVSYAALGFPGIYVTLVLTFFYPLVVTEDKNPWQAFKECFELVWKNWWRTAAIILVPTLIFFAINFAIDYFLIKIYDIYHPDQGLAAIYPHLIRLVLAAFYFPFIASLILIQLNDLKIRKGLIPKNS